jgi:hypothetical protein
MTIRKEILDELIRDYKNPEDLVKSLQRVKMFHRISNK